MADDEQFSLCWNNFNSNLSAGFHESLCRGDLVDVTLAAEGQFVKAHRLVLSVCSPYFRKMFTQMPANQHAFVFLKDVSHSALKDLIQFMYCGEVNVKQEALPAFISTAEALQIKGLTDSDPPQSQTPPEPSTPTPQVQHLTSPRVRHRTSTSSRSYKLESIEDTVEEHKPQATQIVIQTTAAPPQSASIVHHAGQHLQATQTQQIVTAAPATATTTVLTHKRPAQRSIGAPHIKRTKSTIETIDASDHQTSGVQQQQITVQTAVVTSDKHEPAETEYIDLPIELPTKSEPEYAEESGDVESGEQEATYVEEDSYGDIRYDESYFTENEEGPNTVSNNSVNNQSSAPTTSKALIKQQTSFSDSSYVESGTGPGDQTSGEAQEMEIKVDPSLWLSPSPPPPKKTPKSIPGEQLLEVDGQSSTLNRRKSQLNSGGWVETMLTFAENRSGGFNLSYGGFLYRRTKKTASTNNWICHKRNCPARCVTAGKERIKLGLRSHNHQTN